MKNNNNNKVNSEYMPLIRLGVPVLFTQLGIIVVSFADTMMVGLYGVDELAAAAFVNSLFLIPMVMQIGFAAGLTPLIGALFGRGDREGVGRTLRAGVQINLLLSVVLTAIMAGIYPFLHCFGQPAELLPLIRDYYLIMLGTLIPMVLFNVFQQTANGINNTSLPMWVILGCNVLNICGNWLLIFGNWGFPELGLVGAGYSTLLARVLGPCVIIAYFFMRRSYRGYMEGYRTPGAIGELRREVWRTSYPVMIQSGVECSLWSFGAVVSGWFGKIQLAGYQVVTTMGQLGFMTFISFGTATTIRVSNYQGVNDLEGMNRTASAGLRLNLLLATIASAIFMLGGKWAIRGFTADESVILSAYSLIIPLVVYQYMDAIQLTFCNAIRGTSQVKPLLWISLLSYLAVGVPVLLLFAKGFGWGNVGVYVSFDVSLAVAAVAATLVFRRIMHREFTRKQSGNLA